MLQLRRKMTNRFNTILADVGSPYQPKLASGDYEAAPIHDGNGNTGSMKRTAFGGFKKKSGFKCYYQFSANLRYPDPNPEAPHGSLVHYQFNWHSDTPLTYDDAQLLADIVLKHIYTQIGLGTGTLYQSIIPSDKINQMIDREAVRIEGCDLESYHDWELMECIGLHYVDPATIPEPCYAN